MREFCWGLPRNRRLHGLIHDEPEDIGASVVADDIQVELAASDLGEVEVGGEEGLSGARWAGQDLAERIDERASASQGAVDPR
jgi:hypothetical protein